MCLSAHEIDKECLGGLSEDRGDLKETEVDLPGNCLDPTAPLLPSRDKSCVRLLTRELVSLQLPLLTPLPAMLCFESCPIIS